ncbi:MAG: DUF3795 domain-containing protein [Lachnospiraceae bacterium]|nr:DUF3795 domain-containing protein [Lachnospiraceae bacterium]
MCKEDDFSMITACGECCDRCRKKVDGFCPGCVEADGYVPEWAESKRCRVHACARNHKVQFCGICDEFPCPNLSSMIPWNSQIVKHLKDLAKQYHGQKGKTGSEHD